jgi:UDP-glucuronate 4-epimerase
VLLEAAAAHGALERVVYASSSSVYGDRVAIPMREDARPEPVSPYGVSKLAAEQLCYLYFVNFGVPTVSLRYFTVYGPRQRPDMAFTRLVEALAGGGEFELYGDGSQSRSFTYVSDVVAATVAAMERAPRGAVYNVGGGTEATVREVIDALERISGRTLALRELPAAPGDVKRTAADTTRIRGDLGWQPRTSLEDGLRAHWEWAEGRVAAQ